MPLQNYQIQLPDGTVTGAGQNVGFTEVTGIRDTAGQRAADVDRSSDDGSMPGPSYLSERTVGVKFVIAAPTGTVESAMQSLSRNWQNVQDPSMVALTSGDYLYQQAVGGSKPVSSLQLQLPNRAAPILALGRPGKLGAPITLNAQYGLMQVEAEWTVPDGKLYDATVNAPSVGLPASLGGAAFPWTFPVNFGPSSGGTLQAVNAGTYPAKPVFKVTGPCMNPKISNPATGQYVRCNLALQAGDVLTIDTQSRVVRLNGTNRNNTLDVGSSFFTIPPGGTALQFASTDSGTVAGQVTVYTLNTYSVV